MIWIGLDTINGAYTDAGGFVVMAYAFSAFCWVDLIDFSAHINGFVRALWIAHVTVNAFAVY